MDKICIRGWDIDTIRDKFGMDDSGECNKCENLSYQNGMMECNLLKGDNYENQ